MRIIRFTVKVFAGTFFTLWVVLFIFDGTLDLPSLTHFGPPAPSYRMHSPEGALLWTISLFCVGPFLLFWVRAFLAGIDEGYDAAEAVVIKNRRLFFLAFAAGIAVILVGNAMAGFP